MFYVIKDNAVYEYGDNVTKAWNYPEEAKELEGFDMLFYEQHKEQFKVQNGCLEDISGTDEYIIEHQTAQKNKRISEIKTELDALDIKCIRAMREGGNDEDGVPFLEKYQAEINTLREEINSLEQ